MSSVYTPTPVVLGGITIPDDGDGPIQVSDVNVALEAVADGVAFVGAGIATEEARATAAETAITASVAAVTACRQLIDLQTAISPVIPDIVSPGSIFLISATAPLISGGIPVIVGDLVEVTFSSYASLLRYTSTDLIVNIALQYGLNGAAPVNIPGTVIYITIPDEGTLRVPINIAGIISVAAAGTLDIALTLNVQNSGAGDQVAVGSGSTVVYKVWRLL